jgi:hypothetical protein
MAHICARKGELRVNRGMEWVTQLLERVEAGYSLPIYYHLAFERLCELTPPPIRMDCSFSLKDEKLVSAQ